MTLPTASESVREDLRNVESLLQSWIMELAKDDMTTEIVRDLAQARDRTERARERVEEVRALTRGPVSAEVAVTVYWKVRELL